VFMCLCVPPNSILFSMRSLSYHEAYEITLLSVCLRVSFNFFVFYAVRAVSKENRSLVFPRFIIINFIIII
jgi:hypothetical protein